MTLLLVYNADAGLFNALTDTAHKLLSPETYACHLCALTHHPLGMRRPWKDFLAGLGVAVAFLHRDEFHRTYPGTDIRLPAILAEEDGALRVLVPADTLEACADLDALQATVRSTLRSSAD